jgi:hypothetical protein
MTTLEGERKEGEGGKGAIFRNHSRGGKGAIFPPEFIALANTIFVRSERRERGERESWERWEGTADRHNSQWERRTHTWQLK